MSMEKHNMFAPEAALIGRATPIIPSQPHAVNGTPINDNKPQGLEEVIVGMGCFWGAERLFWQQPGVYSTSVGYSGGFTPNPTYEEVCTGKTGHAEAVEVLYDPAKTSYEKLAKLFFETHNFTQLNRQGPDIGTQYRSGIFYLNEKQRQIGLQLIETLRAKGYEVKTELTAAGKFWPAEKYHQDYYEKTTGTPYCHIYRKIF